MIKSVLARYSEKPPVTGLFFIVFIIFAVIMIWSTVERQHSFMTNQVYFGEKAAVNARDAVQAALSNRKRFVQLFVEDKIELISVLVADPENEQLFNYIKQGLLRYIPDLFTINLTNDQGQLLISDFEGFTGPMCLNDVMVFSESGHHLSKVHPNHILYHYDVLERFEIKEKEYVFFASFGLNEIAKALKHASPEGHKLILVRDVDSNYLIEISELGSRDKIKDRVDFRMTNEELSRVLSKTKVKGTQWVVLDTIEESQVELFNAGLIKQNIIVFFIFTLLLIIVRYFIVAKILKQSRKIQVLNQGLQELVLVDGLTGLYNKGYLNSQLEKEWSRALRDKKEITVMLIDIDHFKLYNDNYGHVQGDKCLQEVALVIKEVFQRENDFVSRFGGEEFCVVLNDQSAENPAELASKVHALLKERKITHEFSPTAPHVTISIGVASIVPNIEMVSEWLVNKADRALYKAKHEGRNTTCYDE